MARTAEVGIASASDGNIVSDRRLVGTLSLVSASSIAFVSGTIFVRTLFQKSANNKQVTACGYRGYHYSLTTG
jgi:hypothetical protein